MEMFLAESLTDGPPGTSEQFGEACLQRMEGCGVAVAGVSMRVFSTLLSGAALE